MFRVSGFGFRAWAREFWRGGWGGLEGGASSSGFRLVSLWGQCLRIKKCSNNLRTRIDKDSNKPELRLLEDVSLLQLLGHESL